MLLVFVLFSVFGVLGLFFVFFFPDVKYPHSLKQLSGIILDNGICVLHVNRCFRENNHIWFCI